MHDAFQAWKEREGGRDLCKGREAVGSVRYIVKGRTEHGVKKKSDSMIV